MTPRDPTVTLTVWRVPAPGVPRALLRMALDRRLLRRTPGLRFWRLLGTGDGRTLTLRDADPLHWALLAVWDAPGPANGPTDHAWAGFAAERLRITMTPLASRGAWGGRDPFATAPRGPDPAAAPAGPVAAITRARLRPTRARSFWAAVPPVSHQLGAAPGLRLALGVGEAPIGLQGTFSLWDGAASLTAFAHHGAHREVVARTGPERWYAEDLFARFAVDSVEGTFRGRVP